MPRDVTQVAFLNNGPGAKPESYMQVQIPICDISEMLMADLCHYIIPEQPTQPFLQSSSNIQMSLLQHFLFLVFSSFNF